MESPTGTVLSLVDSPDGARAIVAVRNAPACPRCAAGKGCGAGLLATGQGDRRIEASVPDGLSVAVDDEVEVSLAPDNILRAALIVYGVPLLGALGGAIAAYVMGFGDEGAVLSALFGLAAGLAVGRRKLRQAECLRRFTPTIERRR